MLKMIYIVARCLITAVVVDNNRLVYLGESGGGGPPNF